MRTLQLRFGDRQVDGHKRPTSSGSSSQATCARACSSGALRTCAHILQGMLSEHSLQANKLACEGVYYPKPTIVSLVVDGQRQLETCAGHVVASRPSNALCLWQTRYSVATGNQSSQPPRATPTNLSINRGLFDSPAWTYEVSNFARRLLATRARTPHGTHLAVQLRGALRSRSS